jgi:hypothetical protein
MEKTDSRDWLIVFFNAVLVAGCNPVVVTMGAVVVFTLSFFTFAGAFVFGLVITIGSAAASAHVAVEPSFIAVVLMVAIFSGSVVLGAIFDASNDEAITHKQQGLFLALFLPAIFLVCLVAPILLASNENWGTTGSILLFLGLLTLFNAPFDWASLGLTRALLRRGLELGGWWPYLLAFVDAVLASVIIALLALVMVIGVQMFDELAVRGGGKPVLPLDALFDGIGTHPEAPEYWWVYALLLSSMIPSLINLMISGMAFTRGIPSLARLLLQWIPEGKAMPEYKRQPAAMGLTSRCSRAQVSASRRKRSSPGASFSMSCPGLASTCSTWPAPSRISIYRCGSASFSQAS